MDKAESSSDSDSSVSASWVFVSENASCKENNTNTFHLDCSREPIQELTEQDLLSTTNSDIESDTDGISVISESEVPTDEPALNISQSSNSQGQSDEFQESSQNDDAAPSALVDTVKDLVSQPRERPPKCSIKINNLIAISLIGTAIFLASYFSITNINDLENKNEQSQSDVMINNHGGDRSHKVENDVNKHIEKIVDLTLSCTYGKRTQNYVKDREIKKCVQNEYRTKIDLNKEKVAPFLSNDFPEHVKIRNKEKYYKFNQKYKNRVEKSILMEKDKDEMIAGSFMKRAKHNENRYEKVKHNYEGKQKNDKYKTKNKMGIPKHSCNKNDRDYKNKKGIDKCLHFERNTNNFVNFKTKNFRNKRENHTTKYKENSENKINQSQKSQDSNTTTGGEWYTNWYNARSRLRKEEHVSDWVFERAHIRNKKRNKAQWYFKWMDVRAQLRYKQNYRPYSI